MEDIFSIMYNKRYHLPKNFTPSETCCNTSSFSGYNHACCLLPVRKKYVRKR